VIRGCFACLPVGRNFVLRLPAAGRDFDIILGVWAWVCVSVSTRSQSVIQEELQTQWKPLPAKEEEDSSVSPKEKPD